MSLGSFFKKLWASIEKAFSNIGRESRVIISVSVNVVENLKKFVDSPAADIITALIPGNVDDTIKQRLRIILPQILTILKGFSVDEQLSNEQLKSVVVELNEAHPDVKKIMYHGIAALVTEKLSAQTSAPVAWMDAIPLVEYKKNFEAA